MNRICLQIICLCALLAPTLSSAQDAEKYTDIVLGDSHHCGLTNRGRVLCVQDDPAYDYGQAAVPADLPAVKNIKTRSRSTCVTTMTDEVRCWPTMAWGGSVFPRGTLGPVQFLSAGTAHGCAIDASGILYCGGANAYSQSTVPSDVTNVSLVSAGDDATCAVMYREDNRVMQNVVRCWGKSQLIGQEPSIDTDKITAIGIGSNGFADTDFACVLTDKGNVNCWGGENAGDSVNVPSGLLAKQLAVGFFHTCAIDMNDHAICWGDEAEPTWGAYKVPADLGPVQKISAGRDNTCALTAAGTVRCWGKRADKLAWPTLSKF